MHKKLMNKDFLLMLQGSAVSALGDVLYSVAIGYWVYDATGSSTLMGIMSSISMFMVMLVTPFSGTVVDRCDRKTVIVGMDALRGLLMLAVGALAFSGSLSVPVVLLAAFLASACSVFFSPAVSTLMIDMIPRDDMVRGQSINSGVTTLVDLIGEAVSGMLVAFLGVPAVITLNGISYLLSAFTEAFITVPKTKHQGERVTPKGILGDLGKGFRAIWQQPCLKLCVPCVFLVNLLGSGSVTLMLPFALEKGYTVEVYGYLMSLVTASSLLCVVLLSVVKLSPSLRYYAMAAGFTASMVFSVFAYLSESLGFLCPMLALSCFGNVLGNSVFSASLNLALPEENRGGIMGIIMAGCSGGSALSAVGYGILCDAFPIYLVFIAGAVLTFLPMLYLCTHKAMRTFILEN